MTERPRRSRSRSTSAVRATRRPSPRSPRRARNSPARSTERRRPMTAPSSRYAWTFGDTATGSGATTSHTYADPGTYPITLTVTDNLGATDDVSASVTVPEQSGSGRLPCIGGRQRSGANASVVVPAAVQPGDQLLFFVTANVDTTATTPAGWTLLGSQQDGGPDMRSWVFTRTAVAGTAGSTVTSTLGNWRRRSRVGCSSPTRKRQCPRSSHRRCQPRSSTGLASPPVARCGQRLVRRQPLERQDGGRHRLDVARLGHVSAPPMWAVARVGSPRPWATRVASAGTWPGATATTAAAGTKGIAWSVVVPPA